MATATPRTPTPRDESQCVEMRLVDWKGYLTMLRLRGERLAPKVIYLDGSLLLVSPSFPHEFIKKRLSASVQEVVVGLKTPCIPTGSSTLRRQRKRGGVEGAETYYLASASQIIGKRAIDLRTDPPPDLAIEVVHTHSARAAVEVYRRLGVPEVWVCDGQDLQVLVLQHDRRYAEAEASAIFSVPEGRRNLGVDRPGTLRRRNPVDGRTSPVGPPNSTPAPGGSAGVSWIRSSWSSRRRRCPKSNTKRGSSCR